MMTAFLGVCGFFYYFFFISGTGNNFGVVKFFPRVEQLITTLGGTTAVKGKQERKSDQDRLGMK